ncbi:flagellar hook-basal body complex protein [Mameliella sediminis]|uniref:flagellar hook-basal body complex protein n=1 Tax=Mameliella sediminis TaxID=2836866 RepID=UPI001C49408E|nr:flagellar hook-basal body complex protein [Mameliella sediminis]MBY6114048.1 flagellar hook-basal body complex protein [Antarctobacter heliothermus]MBY6142604.1 flagellar hook-basal body complex protein [Mameliella alba]MBV7395345.1 flagellar hook-basal body complex protein [Mameliella sediminis]MBY6159459.1 flagellar hook-basal body complex protein [Mameliella alba]MBY6167930.1 flagellar hook-basal body complex protein [Mameliella alba]
METAGYAALSRQTSLMREMQVIANNIANANTTGFRQEGMIFSEYVAKGDGMAAVAMGAGRIGTTSFKQGTLEQTGGLYDLAIEGDGFFLVETAQGQRLTRAGAFTPNAEGTLVTTDGDAVLDESGAPIFVPPQALDLAVARDGTISSEGRPIGRVGIVRPLDPKGMVREGGLMFRSDAGFEPVEEPRVMQGFVEASNVDPILQVARMVEVQRAYELGQSFMEREDERIRGALKNMIK